MVSRNFFVSLAEDESSGDDVQTISALPLTAGNLSSQNSSFQAFPGRLRDDDAQSVASAHSTLSAVSYRPSPHAVRRSAQRNIPREEVEYAKMQGDVSLSILIQEGDSTLNVREEILGWGTRLKEAIPQLELQKPEVRGASQLTDIVEARGQAVNAGGMRLQMEVCSVLVEEGSNGEVPESARLGRTLKKWLASQGFFKNKSRRIMYRRENLVVVEGRTNSEEETEIITVFEHVQNKPEAHARRLGGGMWQLTDPEQEAFIELKNSFDRFMRDGREETLAEVLQTVKKHPRTRNQWVNVMSWAVLDLTETDQDIPCRTLADFQHAVCARWLQHDIEKTPVLDEYKREVKRRLPSFGISDRSTVRAFASFLAHLAVFCMRCRVQILWENLDVLKEPLYEEVLGPLTEADKARLKQMFKKNARQQWPQEPGGEGGGSRVELEGVGGGRDGGVGGGETDRDGGAGGDCGVDGGRAGGGRGGEESNGGGGGEGEGSRGGLLDAMARMTPRQALTDMMDIVWTIPRFWADVHAGHESFESAFVRNRALHVSLRAAMDVLDRVQKASDSDAQGEEVQRSGSTGGGSGTEGQDGRDDTEEVEGARLWLSIIKQKFFEDDWSSIEMGIGSPLDGITAWEVNPSSFDELKAVVGFANLIHTRLHCAGDYDLLEESVG